MRLTKEQIEQVILEYRDGKSASAIGAMFDVSGNAIQGLLKRRGIELRSLSEAARKLPCNHLYFQEQLDEERAYWIGFILADGAIHEKAYGVSAQVSVALADKDHGHLEKFKAALQSSHKIITTKQGDHLGVRFSVSSTEMVESLARFGIVPRKSANQVFSDLIPANLLRHYFRGYFDGNGCITRSKSSRWTINIVSSEVFLSRFLDWIGTHIGGHRPSIGFSYGIHRVAWSGTHRCKEILDLLYSDATIYLDRKKALYDAACFDASTSPRSAYNRQVSYPAAN